MSLIAELKRRNVFRVGVAYVISAWVIVEASSLVLDIFGSSELVKQIIVALLALGLPFAMLFAWVFEVTPEGIKREVDLEGLPAVRQHTARRLDILTIAMVVVAIAFLAADRFISKPALVVVPVRESTPAAGAESTAESAKDVLWATRQLLEIDRLRDLGKNDEAFALALDVAPLLEQGYDEEALWAGISWATQIHSEPAGAHVYRQPLDADINDWEELGLTPLDGVRFPLGTSWRVRLDLEGHRSVEMLDAALWIDNGGGETPAVHLDPEDVLPEDMVRIPGFSHDLVEYGDFFMDRFEVTNRDFARFVTAGGYPSETYWTEPFTLDGREISWHEAVSRFTDRTGRPGPSTWSGGAYPSGEGNYPVSGIGWYEAVAYARFVDKELPARAHFQAALRLLLYNSYEVVPRGNFNGDGSWPVGTNRAMNNLGVYDLIGNVREWCWNPDQGALRCTTGAAWNDIPYSAGDLIPKSPWDRDATNGFRLVRTFDSEEKTARLRQPEEATRVRDFYSEEPVPDAEYEIYKRMYAYDDLPLDAETVRVDRFDYWRREEVAFDLPSGKRGGAYLFIPNNATPPFQTILYWPGSDSMMNQTIDDIYENAFGYLVKSGYAVAMPIFWGTFGREHPEEPINAGTLWFNPESTYTTKYRDLNITWMRELSRTLDYLQGRQDIDSSRLGFYGVSWGGGTAPIALALEGERFRVAVVLVGGLDPFYRYHPEIDAFNFITRMQTPMLMVNGEFDVVYPLETAQKPMFDYMGTDPSDKKLHVVPADHWVPEDVLIRESLDWFDKYLGH